MPPDPKMIQFVNVTFFTSCEFAGMLHVLYMQLQHSLFLFFFKHRIVFLEQSDVIFYEQYLLTSIDRNIRLHLATYLCHGVRKHLGKHVMYEPVLTALFTDGCKPQLPVGG